MSVYKFTTINNRVRLQQDNGATLTPAPNDITTSSIGNLISVMVKNAPVFTIDTVADTLNINSTLYGNGGTAKTGDQGEALIIALFLSANSGSGSTSMTKTQRDAISSPTAGTMIYNTTDGWYDVYDSFWGWMPLSISDEWRRHYGASYFREFYNTNTDGFVAIITANSGTIGGNAAPSGSTSENGSTVALVLATTLNARAGFVSSNGTVVFGSGITIYEGRIYIPALSNSTDRFQLIAGFHDNTNGVDQVDGAYFLYDEGGVTTGSAASGNWQLVTASNSVRTFTTSASAIAIATWYVLRIELNAAGTLATFYVNGTSIGTIATNIPTGIARSTGLGILAIKSVGTTTRSIFASFIYFKQKYSTPR